MHSCHSSNRNTGFCKLDVARLGVGGTSLHCVHVWIEDSHNKQCFWQQLNSSMLPLLQWYTLQGSKLTLARSPQASSNRWGWVDFLHRSSARASGCFNLFRQSCVQMLQSYWNVTRMTIKSFPVTDRVLQNGFLLKRTGLAMAREIVFGFKF